TRNAPTDMPPRKITRTMTCAYALSPTKSARYRVQMDSYARPAAPESTNAMYSSVTISPRLAAVAWDRLRGAQRYGTGHTSGVRGSAVWRRLHFALGSRSMGYAHIRRGRPDPEGWPSG